mgnify:CR=1 FL=1
MVARRRSGAKLLSAPRRSQGVLDKPTIARHNGPRMTNDPRIAQFEKMAREDPDNELGHFSLGKAYLDSGRAGDAVEPLQRVSAPRDQNLQVSPAKLLKVLVCAHVYLGSSDQRPDSRAPV